MCLLITALAKMQTGTHRGWRATGRRAPAAAAEEGRQVPLPSHRSC